MSAASQGISVPLPTPCFLVSALYALHFPLTSLVRNFLPNRAPSASLLDCTLDVMEGKKHRGRAFVDNLKRSPHFEGRSFDGMDDSLGFLANLLSAITNSQEFDLDSHFIMKFNSKCHNCHSALISPKSPLILIDPTKHVSLGRQFGTMMDTIGKCRGCGISATLNLPSGLVFRIEKVWPSANFVLESSITLDGRDTQRYILASVIVSSGVHATCYRTHNGSTWYHCDGGHVHKLSSRPRFGDRHLYLGAIYIQSHFMDEVTREEVKAKPGDPVAGILPVRSDPENMGMIGGISSFALDTWHSVTSRYPGFSTPHSGQTTSASCVLRQAPASSGSSANRDCHTATAGSRESANLHHQPPVSIQRLVKASPNAPMLQFLLSGQLRVIDEIWLAMTKQQIGHNVELPANVQSVWNKGTNCVLTDILEKKDYEFSCCSSFPSWETPKCKCSHLRASTPFVVVSSPVDKRVQAFLTPERAEALCACTQTECYTPLKEGATLVTSTEGHSIVEISLQDLLMKTKDFAICYRIDTNTF